MVVSVDPAVTVGEHERGEVLKAEVLAPLPTKQWARKVKIPTLVTGGGAVLILVLGLLGFAESETTPLVEALVDNLLTAIGSIGALVTSVNALIGYFTIERQT